MDRKGLQKIEVVAWSMGYIHRIKSVLLCDHRLEPDHRVSLLPVFCKFSNVEQATFSERLTKSVAEANIEAQSEKATKYSGHYLLCP
jgi:hypothetical protein